MATRYFKSPDERSVVTTSTGNRSKQKPGEPMYIYDWIEIDHTEFNKLRRKIVGRRIPRTALCK